MIAVCYECVDADLPTPHRRELFSHMHQEHGLTLMEGDLDEICRIVAKMEPDRLDGLVARLAEHSSVLVSRGKAREIAGDDAVATAFYSTASWLNTLVKEFIGEGDL